MAYQIKEFVRKLLGAHSPKVGAVEMQPSTADAPIVEPQAPVAETPSQPAISVDVHTDGAVQVQVHVRTEGGNTFIAVDTTQATHCRPDNAPLDGIYLVDGIAVSEDDRYHEHFRTATSTILPSCLSNADIDGILDKVDRQAEFDSMDAEFGDDLWMSPDVDQIQLYYQLRRYCEIKDIAFDRRNIPESFREYQLSIRGLCCIIRRNRQRAATSAG